MTCKWRQICRNRLSMISTVENENKMLLKRQVLKVISNVCASYYPVTVFEKLKLKFCLPWKSRSRSRRKKMVLMPFDRKCLNVCCWFFFHNFNFRQNAKTNKFCKLKKFEIENVGQGHGVEKGDIWRSIAIVWMYLMIFS